MGHHCLGRFCIWTGSSLCVVVAAVSATAATFTIADGDVAGLKSAIVASNTNGEDDVIQLAAAGSYTLTAVETNVGGDTGLPIITADSGHGVTIAGVATTIQRGTSGTPGFRIFQITSGAKVTLSGLVVNNGEAVVTSLSQISQGGGVINGGSLTITNCVFHNNAATGFTEPTGGGGGLAQGGAISNAGSLFVFNSAFDGNTAAGGNGGNAPATGGNGFGGAVANQATATISATTFSSNSAVGGIASGSGGRGGGGAIITTGSLSLSNCTVANNKASGQNSARAFGGGIALQAGASLRLTNCTISGNEASSQSFPSGGGPVGAGGVEVVANSTATLRNTIIAANTATSPTTPSSALTPDVNGSFTSEGHNFIGSTTGSSGWTDADFTGTDAALRDAKLRPLNYNLGPTQTIALRPDSECINNGDDAVLADPFDLTTDQRGQPRKIGAHVDIGAFEFDPTYQNAFLAVNKFDDHDDGSCDTTDCTLREAINQANTTSGLDAIVFAPVAGTVTITLNNAAGVLTISDSVMILGPGARALTISGNQQHTVFAITAGSVVISGVTISDGTKNGGLAGETNQGGGIFNQATLTLNDSAVVSNTAMGAGNSANGGAGGNGQGGGIYNASQLTLNRCTFRDNSAQGAPGTAFSPPPGVSGGVGGKGGSGQGSALLNAANAFATINNCTFTRNKATGGAGGASGGTTSSKASGGDGRGAIFDAGGTLITAVTISGNTGTGGKGAGTSFSPGPNGGGTGGMTAVTSTQQHTVRNTIVAGNTGTVGDAAPDADGAFTSGGYNLIGIGDQSTGFTATGDQVGTAATPLVPNLDSLKNNGGLTDTMALLPGSRALDAGAAFGLATDQRGVARPQDDPAIANAAGGDGSDIGAFELGVATPTPTPSGTPGTTPTPTATPTATPTPTTTPTPPSQLQNLSTRKQVGTGDNVLIGGFIVVGSDDKKVLLRGLGPSLPVTGALADPVLELHGADTTLLGANGNWRDAANADDIAAVLPPSNDFESAILTTLSAKPASDGGAGYTGVLAGSGGTIGIGLLEIYDLDTAANSTLANISTRGFVGTGDDLLIGGFIPGPADRLPIKVLVRALGPSLSAQGVAGALQDPLLELHDANGIVVQNDNWKEAGNASEIESTLPPPDDRESAIITILAPSNAGYTAVVRGVNGTTGVALVEVYALHEP